MLRLLKRRNRSRKTRRRLFLYWLIALILIGAAFSNIFRLVSSFVSSLNSPTGTKLTFEKFEGEKITGVIVSDPLILATYDPVEKKVNIFEMPENLYLEVPEKGFFLASKINELGETKDIGAKLLATTVTSNFLVPVDFYLAAASGNIDKAKILEIREKIPEAGSLFWFFKIPNSGKILKTNFTLFDQFKLFWELRKVRGDKLNYQTVPPSNFEELILPNGDRVVKVSEDGLTPNFLKVFQDFEVAKEAVTVGVFNAAGVSGLAQKVRQICQNLGAQCIVGGEADEV